MAKNPRIIKHYKRQNKVISREAFAVDDQLCYPSEYVVRCLEIIAPERGLPAQIRVDYGLNPRARLFGTSCEDNNIHIPYIQPGKRTQNASSRGLIDKENDSSDNVKAIMSDSLQLSTLT